MAVGWDLFPFVGIHRHNTPRICCEQLVKGLYQLLLLEVYVPFLDINEITD